MIKNKKVKQMIDENNIEANNYTLVFRLKNIVE
jgi:hypothetical protein